MDGSQCASRASGSALADSAETGSACPWLEGGPGIQAALASTGPCGIASVKPSQRLDPMPLAAQEPDSGSELHVQDGHGSGEPHSRDV
jgi:hypothetical protein